MDEHLTTVARWSRNGTVSTRQVATPPDIVASLTKKVMNCMTGDLCLYLAQTPPQMAPLTEGPSNNFANHENGCITN
jgi:hypothetical protein